MRAIEFSRVLDRHLAIHAQMEAGSKPPGERGAIMRDITLIKLIAQEIITARGETPQQVLDRNRARLSQLGEDDE